SAEIFQNVAALSLRAFGETEKFSAAIICNAKRIQRSGNGACCADLLLLCFNAIERGGILAHKVFRPRRAAQVSRESAIAKAHKLRAALIFIPTAMLRQTVLCARHVSEPRPMDWSSSCCQLAAVDRGSQ